jgi:hypothetical protein
LAESDVARKLHVYHTLYRLNLSFARIVEHCAALGESGILSPKFTRLYQSYSQELQAEINEDVVDVLGEVELRNMHRFGKARLTREKELRDPDDVFIHAEERRRDLARHGKKPPTLKGSKTLRPPAAARKPKQPRKESAS